MKNSEKRVLACGVLAIAACATFGTATAGVVVPYTIAACPPYCSSPSPRPIPTPTPAPTPIPTPTPTPAPTPNAQQIQQLQSTIVSVTPGVLSSSICIVTYQNYTLASMQKGDTGDEELWEFGNGSQWLSIARVGGAFTSDLMTNQFNVPTTAAQQLTSELDASSC